MEPPRRGECSHLYAKARNRSSHRRQHSRDVVANPALTFSTRYPRLDLALADNDFSLYVL